jgi:fructokinase
MVYCIGETVLDIIFRDRQPVTAKPGGSMLNSAISLGRAGISVEYISDFGLDIPGDIIHDFLIENNVSLNYSDRYLAGKTALALAFLNENQDAEYSFYKIFPDERLNFSFPVIQQGDIVLFGSFYALTSSVRKKLIAFIREARSGGAFILYDPNFRKSHLGELEILKPWIIENISLASMVRGSDEDFNLIFGVNTADEAFSHIAQTGCPALVYTKNKDCVEMVTKDFRKSYTVEPVTPLSTIGAGDAFNAGIIYTYATFAGKSSHINDLQEEIIASGISFSADVCKSMENYISVDFAGQLKQRQTR